MSLPGKIGELEYMRVSRNHRERLLRKWRNALGDDTLTFWEASERINQAAEAGALPPGRGEHRTD